MNSPTHDWTELDKIAHPHYGRGKPTELLDAEFAVELAWDKVDRAIDAYYDRDQGSKEEIEALKAQAEQIEATYQDLYNQIYKEIENVQPTDS